MHIRHLYIWYKLVLLHPSSVPPFFFLLIVWKIICGSVCFLYKKKKACIRLSNLCNAAGRIRTCMPFRADGFHDRSSTIWATAAYMTKCGGFEPPDPYRISGLAIRCNRPLCQHSIFKLLTGFEPADTRSVVVCLIHWATEASYSMRDSNPRFRREKAMTYPACRILYNRQGEIRTLNVHHLGHGFTDRLLQPFAYLP